MYRIDFRAKIKLIIRRSDQLVSGFIHLHEGRIQVPLCKRNRGELWTYTVIAPLGQGIKCRSAGFFLGLLASHAVSVSFQIPRVLLRSRMAPFKSVFRVFRSGWKSSWCGALRFCPALQGARVDRRWLFRFGLSSRCKQSFSHFANEGSKYLWVCKRNLSGWGLILFLLWWLFAAIYLVFQSRF